MSAEENNKALVRKFFEEAWAKGNAAAVDEFMAADYVEHPRRAPRWDAPRTTTDRVAPPV